MAKKAIDKIEEIKNDEKVDDTTKGLINSLLKELDGGKIAEDAKTTEWVSTGIKSLNFLLSGDIDKGIPVGKMILVAGKPQSGKSIIGARIAAHAQKQDFIVVWLDAEHASDVRFLSRAGIDVTKAIYKEIDTIEELQNKLMKILTWSKEKNRKLFIVLDSLSALSGTKEMSDAADEKLTADMGQTAKNIRAVIRKIIHPLYYSHSVLYCVNHVYAVPGGFIPREEIGGGYSGKFFGQIVLTLNKLNAEEGISTKVKVKSKKNREYIEGRTTEFLINYKEGIDDNIGMMDLFKEFDVVKEKGSWFNIDGDEKSYREKDLFENKEVYEELLKRLKEKTKDLNYHTF